MESRKPTQCKLNKWSHTNMYHTVDNESSGKVNKKCDMNSLNASR